MTITVDVDATAALEMMMEVQQITSIDLLMPAAKHIQQNEIDNPPPKKAGAFSKLATDGQRRAYWAKVASGQARHGAGGYIRSGATTGAWKINKGRGEIKVQNSSTGAQWVYGKSTQQPFHGAAQGSGFLRVDQADEKYGKIVVELVDDEIKRRLE